MPSWEQARLPMGKSDRGTAGGDRGSPSVAIVAQPVS
jgi:hypothetical protein